MQNKWRGFLVGCVVLAVGFFMAAPLVAAPTYSQQFWQEIKTTTQTIDFGNAAAPPLYVFMDPQCPHCSAAFQAMINDKTLLAKRAVRIIPVGVLGPKSALLAAGMLASANPARTWQDFETSKKTDLLAPATDAAAQRVLANQALMVRWQLSMVPFFVYQADDGRVMVMKGEPLDITTLY